MAGLDPAIHVFPSARLQSVDARVEPGHDDGEAVMASERCSSRKN